MLTVAQSQMSDQYDRDYLASYKPALSVLFNIFIMAQVRHEQAALQNSGRADSPHGHTRPGPNRA